MGRAQVMWTQRIWCQWGFWRQLGLLLFASGGMFQGEVAAQQRLVELQLTAAAGGELGIQQEWAEILEGVGADSVKISSVRRPESAAIEELPSGRTVVIRVKGVIQGAALSLPGARFSQADVAGIRNYIQKLRDDGAKVALAEKKAFGLTSEQLVGLSGELGQTVEKPTKGSSATEFVRGLIRQVGKRARIPESAWRALDESGDLQDELQGLSAGTALAAALRPAGLVLVPVREQGQEIELAIRASADADEHWPVGWPIDVPVSQAEPKLFQRRDIEIKGFPLQQAVNAVSELCEVPVLYDWNALARKELDPTKTLVTVVKKKHPYYMTIVDVLKQTKPSLGVELRLDENGKPFMWIR
jgi:hypothetical protein